MARPKKIGLDYFSLDTTWDTSMRLLKARFGLLGIGCMVELYKTIYQEGYYVQWDADAKLLFSTEHHIDLATLDAIVTEAVERGMFDQNMLKLYQVLTSRGIQKRWLHIMESVRRAKIDLDQRYDLITVKLIEPAQFDKNVEQIEKEGFLHEETIVSTVETRVNSVESAQKKRKEMKRNEMKVNDKGADAHRLFSLYYSKYQSEYGATPSVTAAKAMSVLKARLASCSLDELSSMLDDTWGDAYLKANGHGFGLVFSDVAIAKWRAGNRQAADLSRLNV